MHKFLMHRGHHSGLVQVVGVIAIVAAVFLGWTQWLLLSVASYLVMGLSISAGFHFLFCHNAYRTNKWIARVMLYLGTLVGAGSSLQWCTAHAAHHKYSDTDQDPHNIKSWRSAWLINYHYPKYDFRCTRLLIKQDKNWHLWFHHYYWAINALTVTVLSLVDWRIAFYGYVLPAGLLLIMGGLHNIVAHYGKQPRDLWWMAPFSVGEWRHGFHHKHPTTWQMGTLTSLLIRLIRKK